MRIAKDDQAIRTILRVACGFASSGANGGVDAARQFCERWLRGRDAIEVDEERIHQLVAFGVSPLEAKRQAACEAAADAWCRLNGGPALLVSPVPRRIAEALDSVRAPAASL
ncbi:hypothetical protein Pla123a_24140 [Posidoniimonas polymericola]|uniref:Uncharacterized protein n=1 Tax=Posidoniimonas polymericola TaxID=2528002 RepID=A0A5C5YQ75_9BACT|nr:hypothetical protein [Posidoniimonas polymericola]TWT76989.1 hypothetical protein Pla123a_24140 [Posidoniimonas polymericola]